MANNWNQGSFYGAPPPPNGANNNNNNANQHHQTAQSMPNYGGALNGMMNTGSFYGPPPTAMNGGHNNAASMPAFGGFDPYMMMMAGSMFNMNAMSQSMMNMNPPPNNANNMANMNNMSQSMMNMNNNNPPQQNINNNTNNNNFSLAFSPPPLNNNNNNNNINHQQQPGPPSVQMQIGPFFGGNTAIPPPPPQQQKGGNNNNAAANYQYDQQLQPMKKKKKSKKPKKPKKNNNFGNSLSPTNNNDGDYSLSAPKPNRQKKVGGRIRNSFLMTGKKMTDGGGGGRNGGLLGTFGINTKPQNNNNNNNKSKSMSERDINALYTEKRKKKVTYSRKETDKMKSKLLSSDKNMKKLRDIRDSKQQNKLIMKKIHLCKYVCDFRAAGDSDIIILDPKEKKRIENKYELLNELSQHLEFSQWFNTMNGDLSKFLESLFKMISHNLFRVLPDPFIKEVIKTDTTGKDAKVTVNKELPSWKHLEVIYKIFECVLKKMKEDPQSKNLVIGYLENFNVISNVIYLLNSEESREELAVTNIISLLYSEYKPVRLFVLGQLSNVCYSYLYQNNRDLNIGLNLFEKNKNQKEYSKQLAVGVKTVLLIFRECLEGADMEEIDGWVELLCSVIIPLHKAPIDEFTLFDEALGKISVSFCEKYFLSFVYIFQGMLRYWPMTSSKKEQLFLHRIGPLLDKADEDLWEFKDKTKCEFHAVFTKLANKMVDAIKSYEYCHYATAEKLFEMLEDDTLQRFLDIYGGKQCWVRLYKGLYDISTKFFWKETIDKSKEFMENCKEEDDIPMQYVDDYEEIEQGKLFPNNETPYDIQQRQIKEKRLKRKEYWASLDRKYQRKNVAKYQKHVYNNDQPMLQLQNNGNNSNHGSKYKIRKKQSKKGSKPPPPPPSRKKAPAKNSNNVSNGLPKPIWDDDDF